MGWSEAGSARSVGTDVGCPLVDEGTSVGNCLFNILDERYWTSWALILSSLLTLNQLRFTPRTVRPLKIEPLLLFESSGLDGECGRRQGHAPGFCDVLLAFGER